MPSDSVRFVTTWFEQVWKNGNLDAVDRMMAPDASMHGLSGDTGGVVGTAAFKPFVENLRGAFPDIEIKVVQTIEQDDLIASRWIATMTHQGDQLGVPASGKRVSVTGMSIARLRNGMMVEGWNNWDVMSLMQQIEALTPHARLMPDAVANQ